MLYIVNWVQKEKRKKKKRQHKHDRKTAKGKWAICSSAGGGWASSSQCWQCGKLQNKYGTCGIMFQTSATTVCFTLWSACFILPLCFLICGLIGLSVQQHHVYVSRRKAKGTAFTSVFLQCNRSTFYTLAALHSVHQLSCDPRLCYHEILI